jgi:hypothetical protein
MELDIVYRPYFSKEKRDKQYQKDLYYKYSLLGY